MPSSMSLLTEIIRDYLDKEDLVAAILRTAVDIEYLLDAKLCLEKEIDFKLMKNWTLGRYIEWATTLNMIDGKWHSDLKTFNTLRNKVAHERGFAEKLDALKEGEEMFEKIKNLVLKLCEFIDETKIEKNYVGAEPEKYRKYLTSPGLKLDL